MAHKVICTICGQQFDRDKIEAVKTSAQRYAHATCVLKQGSLEDQAKAEQMLAEQAKQEKDLIALEAYIQKKFAATDDDDVALIKRTRQQIKTFRDEYKYSYSGILKSLIYFYDIKGNSIDKANGGINIVPYIYNEAKAYYQRLWKTHQINQAKPIEQYIAPTQRIIKIAIPTPRLRTRNKLFSFLDEEEEDNS